MSEALASSQSQKPAAPPGLAKRDAHRQKHRDAIKSKEEWYVRLTIEAPAEQLKDDGNILGQLSDSVFSGHAVNPSMGAHPKHPCFVRS